MRAVALVAAALALAPAAHAATAERDDIDSADVSFLAAPGEANRVVVSYGPEGVRFTDAGAVLTTRTCTSLGTHEVLCAGIADTLIVETGDGADAIDVSAAPIAFAVGGAGDDTIVAARGAGGDGSDVLRGLPTPGRLNGGPGDDEIVGGPGRDVITGGEGGDDTVRGGGGADAIEVQSGADRLDGEAGGDRYVVVRGVRQVAAAIVDSGGDGDDTIELGCAGTRLGTGRYTLAGGTITFRGLEGPFPCAQRRVPAVVGMPLARARRVLAAAGLRVGEVRYRRSALAHGTVISRRPATAAPGTRIALVVSSGR